MICPECREVASFHEHRAKTFTTLLGDVRPVVRPYYHCPHCHAGHFPGDAALELADRRLSPGAEQVVTLAGTLTSFDEAATKVLPKMTGIRLGESTVERTTEAAGQRLGAALEEGRGFGAATPWDWNADAQGRGVAYVSIDATGVGQQGPGGAKAEGRMINVGLIYNAAEFDPEAAADARPIEQARYLAGFIDLDTLGAQLRRQAAQVGMDRAKVCVGLTDGGAGLEEFLRVHFPMATPILDFYHAAGHVADLAKVWASEPGAARELTADWCHRMKHEGGAALLTTLEALDRTGQSPEALEELRLVRGYIGRNVGRMDYPSYLENGWQIGSGSMESGCKTVICQRLCGGGMRWGSDGADSVAHLRALFRSEPGQWEAFWNQSPN